MIDPTDLHKHVQYTDLSYKNWADRGPWSLAERDPASFSLFFRNVTQPKMAEKGPKSSPGNRENQVYMAKLAEQAERYDGSIY